MRTTFRLDHELLEALKNFAHDKFEGNTSLAARSIIRDHCIANGYIVDNRSVTFTNKQQLVAGGDISIENSGPINISDK